MLDFGHVVLGSVRTHIVRATNTGWFPTSFAAHKDHLMQYGFNLELGAVKHLPGAPDHETVDFVVSFDPRGANLGLGETETIVPINVSGNIMSGQQQGACQGQDILLLSLCNLLRVKLSTKYHNSLRIYVKELLQSSIAKYSTGKS